MPNVRILGVAVPPPAGRLIPVEDAGGRDLVACFEFAGVTDVAAVARAMEVLGRAMADGTIDPAEAADLAVILWPELGADGARVVAVVDAVRKVIAGLEDDGQLSAGEVFTIVSELLRGIAGRAIRLEDVGRWALDTVRSLMKRRK